MTKMRGTMVRRGAMVLACAAAVAVAASRPLAAQETLPKAADLLAKYVTAVGGADAVKAIKSVRARGTFEMPAQNLTGSIEVLQARPAFMRLTVDIQGVGLIESGSDGKISWSIDPMSGPALLTGKALNDANTEAQFDGQLFGPDFVKESTTLARTTFGNRPAYKIKIVTVFDSERTLYLDAESFLLIGTESISETPMGSMPTTGSMGDYKKFGPLMQPTTIVQSAMGFDQVARITSYEYDVVPPAAFDLPAQIKALIK